jgi:tripartite-type tricarboxylate transporter receptor subunit TctC
MREQGVDLVIHSWHGVFAPRGTPAPVIAVLEAGLERVSRNAQFVRQMDAALLGVRYMNRAEFSRFFGAQEAQIKPLIQNLGLMVAPVK